MPCQASCLSELCPLFSWSAKREREIEEEAGGPGRRAEGRSSYLHTQVCVSTAVMLMLMLMLGRHMHHHTRESARARERERKREESKERRGGTDLSHAARDLLCLYCDVKLAGHLHTRRHSHVLCKREERERERARGSLCVCVCLENRTLKISNFSQLLPHTASLLLPPPHMYVHVNAFLVSRGVCKKIDR